MKEPRSYGWKNVIYNSYCELPENIQTFDNLEWINKQKKIIENYDSMHENDKEVLIQRNKMLIEYTKLIEKDEITILDFGGGLGTSYLPLADSTSKRVDYHIVETPGLSSTAMDYYAEKQLINFYSTIPQDLKSIDIVYIRTSLQYCEEWQNILKSLFNLDSSYFLMAHLSAGNIPTYLTLQLWGNYEIPYWFINKGEIKRIAEQKNYICIDEHKSYNMKNDTGWSTYQHFPDKYRLEQLSNIVFKKRRM